MRTIQSTVHAALQYAVPSILLLSAAASPVARARQPFLRPNSPVISSTTYDRTHGAIAALTAGTTLPGSATATSAAIASNNYVEVWNNATPDASFGVTSPILLTDIEPHSGQVFARAEVPTNQVVTSFSSKSELGLHVAGVGSWTRLIFVGCGGAGVGAIDGSDTDAVPGQDPTNP